MKRSLTLLFGIMVATSVANARLGESIEQCKARYGEPKRISLDDKLTGVGIFSANDLTIKVHFRNGKADLVNYSPGEVSSIDLDIAKELLKRNGRDKEWEQLTKTEVVLNDIQDQEAQYPRVVLVDPILWKSKDGILDASFSVGKGIFEVKASTFQQDVLNKL